MLQEKFLFLFLLIHKFFALDYSKHLGTKSPYPSFFNNLTYDVPSLLGCELIQVQLISRHGTRNPSLNDINSFNKLMLIGKEVNLTKEFKWIQDWKNPFDPFENSLLVQKGEEELYKFGKRFRTKYNLITEGNYSPLKYPFHSSATSRTSQSASAFSLGAFEGSGHVSPSKIPAIFYETYSKNNDFILDSKNSCPLWKNIVKRNISKEIQVEKYTSLKISPIAKKISSMIKYNIETGDVKAIYKLCAYEIILHNRTSTWCSFLSPESILSLEYLVDLEDYYENSYGHDFNKKMACVLVTNMIKKIEDYSSEASQVTADFQFGHSQTILFFITALGLFEDPFSLTWNLDEALKKNRMFSTSRIAPFTSNIIVELYRCISDATLRVRFLVNEAPVKLPVCSSILCPFEELKRILGNQINCGLAQECSVNASS